MKLLNQQENQLLIEQFLTQNYDIRRNELNKRIEYRKTDSESDYLPLSSEVENTMIRRVKAEIEDVASVKTTIQEFIHSNDIETYNPIRDYLCKLPQWDGKDHVLEFFSRIPGVNSNQLYWLSIWFRSTVAHWLGKDNLHGNECVPVLIGMQGDGKTTFWKALLPPELRCYFLPNINLANKFDKEMALTNNLLVNLDEMDQIKPAHIPELKYLLSVSEVNGRPIYGRIQEVRERYASFVATTNDPKPLHDPTGSRRFICVKIPDNQFLDYDTPVDYNQLYAQAYHEVVTEGKRYWFTNEEATAIQLFNKQYESSLQVADIIESLYRLPEENEQVKPIPLSEIVSSIKAEYPDVNEGRNLNIHVGCKMAELGYTKKKTCHGVMVYAVRVA